MVKSPHDSSVAEPSTPTRSHPRKLRSTFITWATMPEGMATILMTKTALKIAVAATISFVVAQWLNWEYPFYAVISAIIVMGSTYGSTLNLGIQRLIGSAIGAISGAIFATLFGSIPGSLLIGVFVTIFLSSYWKFNEAAKLAGYVSAIVILNHTESPWVYAWGRFLETLLGIGVALAVNQWLFPARAGEELRRNLSNTLGQLEQLYQLVIAGAFQGTYDRAGADSVKASIISSLLKGRDLWKEVNQGQSGEPPEKRVNEAWAFLVRRIWEHILAMEHTVLARQQDTYWQLLMPHLSQLAQETAIALRELAIAVKTYKTHLPLPMLETALTTANEQLDQLQNDVQPDYPMDELLRFFTFLYVMEEVGRKLQRMADNLTAT